MEQKKDPYPCDCHCHEHPYAPMCCISCYLWHGINYRTFKNEVEGRPRSK